MYDLAIIGGGPAGTSAAITAADYGARVLLLEKGSFPRQKVCGEFVSAESLGLLSSLLPANCALVENAPRIRRGRVFIDNRVLETPVEPAAASIARVDLDAALWNSARERGVDARERQNVSTIAGDGPFVIRSGDAEFTSRCVVDASGRWSNLNRRKTQNAAAYKWLGFKAHFREVAPADSVDLYFFEGGYCGVQPVGTGGMEINACAMVRSNVSKSLEECFQQNTNLQERSRTWEPCTEIVSTSPLLFHMPEPLQRNILRAGDAAAFVDPFVGDGISLALRSGALASRSLRSFMGGHGSLAQAAEEYKGNYEREFRRVFRTSSKIRGLLQFPPLIRAGILSVLINFPALTRRMVRSTR